MQLSLPGIFFIAFNMGVKMGKRSLIFLIIASMIFFFGCKGEDEGDVSTTSSTSTDNRAAIVSGAFIDIPSAISNDSGSSTSTLSARKLSSTAPTQEQEPVWAVYEGIRQIIADLETFIPELKNLTSDIFTVIGTSDTGNWTNTSATAGEPTRVAWGPASNGYDSVIELFYAGDQKGFQGYLTVNESQQTAKGVYTWDFSVAEDTSDPSNDAVLQFIFDSTVNPKVLEIKASNISGSDGLRSVWMKITSNDNHVIDLWGNLYFEGLDMFSDSTGDTAEDRNYVFAVTGYDETGVDSNRKNKVILNLAMPLASTASTATMWDDASVSAIFVEKIKEVWTADGITVGQLESWIEPGQQNFTASTINELTYDDVIFILNWADENSGTGDELDPLIFVTQLVNPAYFISNGFLGTCSDVSSDGTCDQGTEAGNPVPSGFGDLDISAVANDVVAPVTVRDLAVTFF